jgi:hypothetical protein
MSDDPADRIAFTELPPADVAIKHDAEAEKYKAAAEAALKRDAVVRGVKEKAGVPTPPVPGTEIPPDLPKVFFRLGSRVISCEKFRLDDEEARIMAKHLTIICGGVNSRLFSILIIITIIVGKVLECFDAIKTKFSRKSIEKKSEASKEDLPPLLK